MPRPTRLDGVLQPTPIEPSRAVSTAVSTEVVLKCENLQRTGSFKMRGAYNRIARLSDEEKARGVVCASAGNHAQGVALAAQMQDVDAVVFMPVEAPLPKVDATSGYGARVELVGESFDDTLAAAQSFARRRVAPSSTPSIIPTSSPGRAPSASSCSARCPSSGRWSCPWAAAG